MFFVAPRQHLFCLKCSFVLPLSFLMLVNGRARTFSQRNSADVAEDVSACPGSCMHRVYFRELKEFETSTMTAEQIIDTWTVELAILHYKRRWCGW
jgi:hypothetical protein